MKVKSWLDYLYYTIGKQNYDFFLCGLKKVGQEIKSTKWKRFSEVVFEVDEFEDYKLNWINQRQILPCEVVLDLEDKNQLPKIINELKNLGVIFYVFTTGSRGYHVHLFFDSEITEEQKSAIIEYFGADPQKSSSKTMISLEFVPHWKSGKIKELIKNGD